MKEESQAEISKGKEIGRVAHYFGNIGVGVIELSGNLKVGDEVVISGRGQEFEQAIDSMQIEHEQIQTAKKGQSVGVKFAKPAKEGDLVFLKG